jgi:5'(3')-deoxyribonucleotidase
MKKILYIDMDNVLVDFESAVVDLYRYEREKYEGRYDEVPGIFARMEPMPDAIESFITLSEYFDTYILSTAPWKNPSAWTDKLIWVQTHLGIHAHKRLILSHNKNLNAGDYLIDDRTANGAGQFRGEHILFGSKRFPDWKAVFNYLITK